MRIKIISSGKGFETKVVNAETGESIDFVRSVRWQFTSPGHLAIATIEVLNVEAEIVGETDIKKLIY